jgi:hypothetical protein
MKLPMAFTICTFGVKPPRHVGGRKEVLGDEKTDREGGGSLGSVQLGDARMD